MLLTENRKLPFTFRFRSGPWEKYPENKEVYPHNTPGPERHISAKICGFSKGRGTEFPIPGLIYGALRELKTNKYNKLN